MIRNDFRYASSITLINYETRAAIGSTISEYFICTLECRHMYQVWSITLVMPGESNLGFILLTTMFQFHRR